MAAATGTDRHWTGHVETQTVGPRPWEAGGGRVEGIPCKLSEDSLIIHLLDMMDYKWDLKEPGHTVGGPIVLEEKSNRPNCCVEYSDTGYKKRN